jgi:hypothetical protein
MDTALRQWLYHFEYPHTRRERKPEASQMLHDHLFWGTVVTVIMVMAFLALFTIAMISGPTQVTTPIFNTQTTWPYSLPY